MPNSIVQDTGIYKEDEERSKVELTESTTFNRTLGLQMLGLSIFCIFLTIATTDLMLFLPDVFRFQIAILNVNLNIFYFYLVCPWALTFLHFNLLVNLQNHGYKLARWNLMMKIIYKKIAHPTTLEKLKSGDIDPELQQYSVIKAYEYETDPWFVHKRQVKHFLPNFLTIRYRTGFNNSLVHFFVYFFTFLFPILVLLFMTARFVAYQNFTVTFIQCCSIIVNCFIAVNFLHDFYYNIDKYDNSSAEFKRLDKEARRYFNIVGAQKAPSSMPSRSKLSLIYNSICRYYFISKPVVHSILFTFFYYKLLLIFHHGDKIDFSILRKLPSFSDIITFIPWGIKYFLFSTPKIEIWLSFQSVVLTLIALFIVFVFLSQNKTRSSKNWRTIHYKITHYPTLQSPILATCWFAIHLILLSNQLTKRNEPDVERNDWLVRVKENSKPYWAISLDLSHEKFLKDFFPNDPAVGHLYNRKTIKNRYYRYASFEGVNFDDFYFYNTDFSNANLKFSNLTGARFDSCFFNQTTMDRIIAIKTSFNNIPSILNISTSKINFSVFSDFNKNNSKVLISNSEVQGSIFYNTKCFIDSTNHILKFLLSNDPLIIDNKNRHLGVSMSDSVNCDKIHWIKYRLGKHLHQGDCPKIPLTYDSLYINTMEQFFLGKSLIEPKNIMIKAFKPESAKSGFTLRQIRFENGHPVYIFEHPYSRRNHLAKICLDYGNNMLDTVQVKVESDKLGRNIVKIRGLSERKVLNATIIE